MIHYILSFIHTAHVRTVMVRCSAFALALAFTATTARCLAQSSEEGQVKSVIAQLFKGMEQGDSALARSCFMPQVTMATVKAGEGVQPVLIRETGIEGWLKSIAAPKADKLYEETYNMKISIDGNLAQVWCDYAFYIGNKFHHCGVDAFHLFKDGSRWKIFHVADTRRTTGCQIPSEIAKKHAQ